MQGRWRDFPEEPKALSQTSRATDAEATLPGEPALITGERRQWKQKEGRVREGAWPLRKAMCDLDATLYVFTIPSTHFNHSTVMSIYLGIYFPCWTVSPLRAGSALSACIPNTKPRVWHSTGALNTMPLNEWMKPELWLVGAIILEGCLYLIYSNLIISPMMWDLEGVKGFLRPHRGV